MAPTKATSLSPADDDAARDAVDIPDLSVHGTIPAGLSGRLLGIGPNSPGQDGVVHSIDLRAGRTVSYRNRWVITDSVARRLGLDRAPALRAARARPVAEDQ